MPRLELHLVPILLLAALPLRAAQVLPQPTVEPPTAAAGSVLPDPVKARAEPLRRLVYSCITPGLRTFSDRPCGPLPQVRELKLPPPIAAGERPAVGAAAAAQRQRTASETTAAARVAAAARERAETCHKLETDLDEIDARMRAGYPAREAGRMWDRWREARTQLRAADC